MSEQTFEEALQIQSFETTEEEWLVGIRAAHARELAAATEEMKRERDEAMAKSEIAHEAWERVSAQLEHSRQCAEKAEADAKEHYQHAERRAQEAHDLRVENVRLREAAAGIHASCCECHEYLDDSRDTYQCRTGYWTDKSSDATLTPRHTHPFVDPRCLAARAALKEPSRG